MALLEVESLTTHYRILRGWVRAVENVSFKVEQGEALGIAGESGSGKSTIALSLLRILPAGGHIRKGKIVFNGKDLVSLSEPEMRKFRWKGISIVFQGAMNAMNPVYKVGDQIGEAITLHEEGVSSSDVKERVAKLLETVGIEPSRANNYPHELSGDEPGTALDVIVQAQTLRLLRDLKDRLGLSMIMITQDLSIIAETCEKVAIMYAGKIVEYGDAVSVFKNPLRKENEKGHLVACHLY